MTSNICSTGYEGLICREKVPDVPGLQDQRNDPVHARDNDIQGEWRPHVSVLTPYCVAVVLVMAIRWRTEGVIEGCNHYEEPGDDCENLVGKQGTFVEL